MLHKAKAMTTGVFFVRQKDWSKPGAVKIVSGTDPEKLTSLKDLGFVARDPSMLRDAAGTVVFTSQGQNDKFDTLAMMSVNTNFSGPWSQKQVCFGSVPAMSSTRKAPGGSVAASMLWAPEWFVDSDGTTYAEFAMKFGNPVSGSGYASGQQQYMRMYYSKLIDRAALKFDAPVAVNMGPGTYIDASTILINGKYFKAVKNQATAKIEIWRADSFAGAYSLVRVLDFGHYVEAPSVVKTSDGLYRVYVDAKSKIEVMKTASGNLHDNWSKAAVSIPFNAAHGSVYTN